jgi:hypothetical protein
MTWGLLGMCSLVEGEVSQDVNKDHCSVRVPLALLLSLHLFHLFLCFPALLLQDREFDIPSYKLWAAIGQSYLLSTSLFRSQITGHCLADSSYWISFTAGGVHQSDMPRRKTMCSGESCGSKDRSVNSWVRGTVPRSYIVRVASAFRVELQKTWQPGTVRHNEVTELECDYSSKAHRTAC